MTTPTSAELRSQATKASGLIKVAWAFWLSASMIVMIAALVWIVLAGTAGDYFSNSKNTRDAADAGSAILSQLGSIQATKDWVLPFAFLGVSMFVAGFGFAFVNILKNVKLRANTMAAALPELKARKQQA
jgi:hypothetical protein